MGSSGDGTLRVWMLCALTAASCLKAPAFNGTSDGSGDANNGDAVADVPGQLREQQWAFLKFVSPTNADHLGASTAISADGKTLAVGMPDEDGSLSSTLASVDEGANGAGAVVVYVESGGTWTLQAYIKSSTAAVGDNLGAAVALSADGNTLVAGAPGDASGGMAEVFVRTGTTWTQQDKLRPSNQDVGDGFGTSVAISNSGDAVAVGAPYEDSNSTSVNQGQTDNSAAESGAAYRFSRTGTTWAATAYIKSLNSDAGDNFGTSVALSDDGVTLAVGAHAEDSAAAGIDPAVTNTGNVYGAAYVFANTTQTSYIKPSRPCMSCEFGSAIALSADGTTLAIASLAESSDAVGVDGSGTGVVVRSGAVYVFANSSHTWAQTSYIKASNPDLNDLFGASLALSRDGNTLLVGADHESSSATGIGGDQTLDDADGAGAAYLFAKVPGWAQIGYIKASNPGAGDRFGHSVAMATDGTTFAISADRERTLAGGVDVTPDDNGTGVGATYVFHLAR